MIRTFHSIPKIVQVIEFTEDNRDLLLQNGATILGDKLFSKPQATWIKLN